MGATKEMYMDTDDIANLDWLLDDDYLTKRDRIADKRLKEGNEKVVIPSNPLAEFAIDLGKIQGLSREEASKEATALTGKKY